MPFPKPVPSLTEEEFDHFLRKLDEFETSEEMENALDRHRDALQAEVD